MTKYRTLISDLDHALRADGSFGYKVVTTIVTLWFGFAMYVTIVM